MDDTLRRIQKIQLEILIQIDRICKKHKIHYSLYAGTMLGAVRHKGFIPWDDDLDICMLRNDYNKFLKVWKKENTNGYILQNKDIEPNFTQSFSKIRKDYTTFIQAEWEQGKYHTGIFVDIFPIDRIPKKKIQRGLFYWRCLKYQLYMREFVPPKASLPVKLIAGFLLFILPKSKRERKRKQLLRKIEKYKCNTNFDCVGIEAIDTLKVIYPMDMFDEYVQLDFEGHKFMCVKKWDECLKLMYGNYMQLPPKNNRIWTHHPIEIDFDKNYGE